MIRYNIIEYNLIWYGMIRYLIDYDIIIQWDVYQTLFKQ